MRIKDAFVSNGHGELPYPQFVVIHETANPGATALNHVTYWSNNPMYAVHYVADWTDTIYHCVPDSRLCYQVGNGNDKVIGIELCHALNKLDFEKVWRNGIQWAAYMLSLRKWNTERLISHDDCRRMFGGTDHTDPISYFASFGKTFEDFKNDVATEMRKDVFEMTSKEIQAIADKVKYAVWAYRNPGLEKVDAYQILRDCRDSLSRIEKKQEELISLINKEI